MKKILILIVLISSSMLSQKRVDATNIRHELYQGKIKIIYDLSMENQNISKIGIQLRNRDDEKFIYNINQAELEKEISGKNKKIICDLPNEYKSKLSGENFYFSVFAVEKENNVSGSLLWLGVGAVIVGGGMATYMILSKEKTSELPNLPNPPGR